MRISDDKIKQFQVLYKKHFGQEISKDEALEKGTKLVELMSLIYRPITKAEYQKYSQ